MVPPEKPVSWWLGPSAEPPDLPELLLALGVGEPADGAAVLHALACVSEPVAGPDDVVVRAVSTLDDYLAWTEVMWEAFDTPAERRERDRPHLPRLFDAERRGGAVRSFLAFLDGRPAGTGRSVYSHRGVFLIAGATAPWARGRGVYRALVRARWDEAVARGTPALVTEAMPDTSLPILLGLGFREVCRIRRLEDVRA